MVTHRRRPGIAAGGDDVLLQPALLTAVPTSPRAWWIRALIDHGPIVGLLAAALGLRLFRLSEVVGQLIGDESWYVQDARVLLGLPVLLHNLPGAPLSGHDTNFEHPPLAKLIMAGSMKLLGEREFAWRLPSVLLGTLAIWLLYRVVLALGGSRGQAFFAAFVLAFENLSFIHGRIAMLDTYMVTFSLLATWLYLSSYFELAGIAFALAALCKLNGLLGLFAVLLYEALIARGRWRSPSWPALRRRALTVLFCVGFGLLCLGALDCFFSDFRSPFAHLAQMYQFHAGIKHVGLATGNESIPPQWWLNSGAFDYLSWTTNTNGVAHYTTFRAAMNEYVIIAAPLALLYAAQRAWLDNSRLGAFAIASVVGNLGPMILVWAVMSRTSYIFYMLPSIPAIACAIALAAFALPRLIRWGYAATILYAFFFFFPFRYF